MRQNLKPSLTGGLPKDRRRKISITPNNLVETFFLKGLDDYPLVVRPVNENVDLIDWARNSQHWIESKLLQYGAILFRDFDTSLIEQFEKFVSATSKGAVNYNERAAARKKVGNNVYTSTEYPADQPIPLHHEMSYSHNFPAKIWFYCSKPADTQGATPIADDRRVFKLLNPEIKRIFQKKKIMYVRNYGEGFDMPWQEVFQTTVRAEVEEYCRASKMIFEWRDGDRLRTKALRQVTLRHPRTGDEVWFNHAHMFHHSNIDPHIRDLLLRRYAEDELPRNALYGDGSAIETSLLDEIRRTYDQCAVRFDWEKGDILMVDNFLSSHGRETFTGPREILVSMAEMHVNTDI